MGGRWRVRDCDGSEAWMTSGVGPMKAAEEGRNMTAAEEGCFNSGCLASERSFNAGVTTAFVQLTGKHKSTTRMGTTDMMAERYPVNLSPFVGS